MKLCGFDAGLEFPLFLIAGPCVVESEQLQMDVAGQLKEITAALGVPFIFKSSYDKANRSSGTTFRGPGIDKGLEILAKVKRTLGVPIITDVHREDEIGAAAEVVDVLQTPAFLCRQTDFIRAVAQSGKPVNIKKGQFLAPHDMTNVLDKARARGARQRPVGRPLPRLRARRQLRLQQPRFRHAQPRHHARDGGTGRVSTRRIRCSFPVARAPRRAGSASSFRCWPARPSPSGVAGVFMETHPDPAKALSDGPNAVPLKHMKALLEQLVAIDRTVKSRPFLEADFAC